MKASFLTYEKPLLTCMVQADNPDRIKELIDLSRPEGAEAFGMQFCQMKEEYRNKGIGKALLDYSEKIAYEMADRFFLVVGDYNPDAKRFYERNGYQQVGEIPNLYRLGITEYLMVKDPKK